MSPTLLKKEPEVHSSLDTMKCIKVKCEEAIVESEEVKGKCEDVMVKSEDVKVKCEDEDSTPKSDLHIDGGNVKQEENSDCEAERGTSQEFVEVEVWVDFLDKTKSNEDPVDVATTNENRLVIQQWRERASHRAVSYRERDTAPSATKNAPPCRQLPRAAKRRQAPPLTSLRRKSSGPLAPSHFVRATGPTKQILTGAQASISLTGAQAPHLISSPTTKELFRHPK
ncbi:unnamed protein product [Lampetra fluviatilis]